VKILLDMKNVEGFETESATLTCELSKSGRTDGQWLFNGQPLTTSERVQLKVDGYRQSIEFAELTIADAGQYTYRIENVSTSATLTVRGTTFEQLCQASCSISEHCLITLSSTVFFAELTVGCSVPVHFLPKCFSRIVAIINGELTALRFHTAE